MIAFIDNALGLFYFAVAMLQIVCLAVGFCALVCVAIALLTDHPASATGIMKPGQRW